MSSFKILIDYPPIPWKRAGYGNSHFYDKQKQDKFAIGLYMRNAMEGRLPFHKPVRLDFQFYFPIPSTNSKKRNSQRPNSHYPYKPDIDNCIKMYLDSANTIIYNDDAQVVHITATKKYSKEPKVLIKVTEL